MMEDYEDYVTPTERWKTEARELVEAARIRYDLPWRSFWALHFRSQGMEFKDIGGKFGVSTTAGREIYLRAVKMVKAGRK